MSSEAKISKETDVGNALEALRVFGPNLIIEGATNNNPALRNLILGTLTGINEKRYVGLDINPEIDYKSFTRFGNCVNPDDVGKVISEHAAQKVAFVTHYALSAILSTDYAPFERKDKRDRTSPHEMAEVTKELYGFQLHYGLSSFWNSLKPYYRECMNLGMHVYDYGEHDLMVVTREPITAPPAKVLTLQDLT